MDRGQNRDSEMPPQQPSFNPDIFLSFGKQDKEEENLLIQEYQVNNPKKQEQPQRQMPKVEEKVQLQVPTKTKSQVAPSSPKEGKQKEPKKYKKRIKKKDGSLDGQESFTDNKHQKKEGTQDKGKGRKSGAAANTKAKGRGKSKTNQSIATGEMKRQLASLADDRNIVLVQEKMNEKVQSKIPQKVQTIKKIVPQFEPNRIEYQPAALAWQHNTANEQDFNSVEAQLCEDSIVRRGQSHTYRRMMQVVQQQGDNLLEKISDLPPLLY